MSTQLTEALLRTLNRDHGSPLARQLYDQIRALILSGDLTAGSRLPASRLLATDIGLSRNTVLTAYEQLLSEGYVHAASGRGTYVSDTVPVLPPSAYRPPSSNRPPEHRSPSTPAALSARGAALLSSAQAARQQWGAFVPGVPDLASFPAKTWLKLMRRHWRSISPGMLTYAHGAGHLPLRQALTEHLRLARAVRCDASQVLITSGIHQSLMLLSTLLGQPGDQAWVENPAYWGATTVLRSCGIVPVPVDVDDEGMAPTLTQLREAPRFIFVTPSHQYPLGTVMSLARRRMLLSYAQTHQSWIIEDDYDSEFRFGGRPIASLQGLDSGDRVIYLGTFSKTLYPGLRMGYLVLPPTLAEPVAAGLSELHREGRLADQAVLADFISEGHYSTHLRRMRTRYAQRQTLLRQAIADTLGADWPTSTQEAGLHLVMHLPDHADDVALAAAAAQRGIALRPLSRYYMAGPPKQGLLFGYACVPEAEIAPAFAKLTDLLTPFRRSS